MPPADRSNTNELSPVPREVRVPERSAEYDAKDMRIRQLEEELEALYGQESSLSEELLKLRRESEELQSRIQSTEDELARSRDEVEQLHARIAAQEAGLNEARAAVAAARGRADSTAIVRTGWPAQAKAVLALGGVAVMLAGAIIGYAVAGRRRPASMAEGPATPSVSGGASPAELGVRTTAPLVVPTNPSTADPFPAAVPAAVPAAPPSAAPGSAGAATSAAVGATPTVVPLPSPESQGEQAKIAPRPAEAAASDLRRAGRPRSRKTDGARSLDVRGSEAPKATLIEDL